MQKWNWTKNVQMGIINTPKIIVSFTKKKYLNLRYYWLKTNCHNYFNIFNCIVINDNKVLNVF